MFVLVVAIPAYTWSISKSKVGDLWENGANCSKVVNGIIVESKKVMKTKFERYQNEK